MSIAERSKNLNVSSSSKSMSSSNNSESDNITGKKRKRSKRFTAGEDLKMVDAIRRLGYNSSSIKWGEVLDMSGLARSKEALMSRHKRLRTKQKKKDLDNTTLRKYYSSLIDKEREKNNPRKKPKLKVFDEKGVQTDFQVAPPSGVILKVMKDEQVEANISLADPVIQSVDEKTRIIEKMIRDKYAAKRKLNNKVLMDQQYTIGSYRRGFSFQKTEFVHGKRYQVIVEQENRCKRLKEELIGEKMMYEKMNRKDEKARIKSKMNEIRRKEQSLASQKQLFLQEKLQFATELKRANEEEKSRYYNFPTYVGNKGRYILVKLIGRGGFSQVWKGIDLSSPNFQQVAVKIHSIDPEWQEQKKMTYVKHVIREMEIIQKLPKEYFVQLYERFVVDKINMMFVLEYVKGDNLEAFIKKNYGIAGEFIPLKANQTKSTVGTTSGATSGGTIREIFAKLSSKQLDDRSEIIYSTSTVMREDLVKSIIYQLMQALVQLKKHDIIHYDLKPSNILIKSNGKIKITDFGLSKLAERKRSGFAVNNATRMISQTTYGAGTYYYQPPECFQKGAKISNKVDIWSMGVIFYQCLYNGKLPFGNEMNQNEMFNQVTQNRQGIYSFFDKLIFPKIRKHGKRGFIEISETAKSFIRDCLVKSDKDRPNIDDLVGKYKNYFLSPK